MRNHAKSKHHSLKDTRGLDRLTLIVGVIQPIMTLPQIITVYSQRDSSQIALITWIAYDIASVVLLMYGMKHSWKPIIFAQIIWLIVQTTMAASVFIF